MCAEIASLRRVKSDVPGTQISKSGKEGLKKKKKIDCLHPKISASAFLRRFIGVKIYAYHWIFFCINHPKNSWFYKCTSMCLLCLHSCTRSEPFQKCLQCLTPADVERVPIQSYSYVTYNMPYSNDFLGLSLFCCNYDNINMSFFLKFFLMLFVARIPNCRHVYSVKKKKRKKKEKKKKKKKKKKPRMTWPEFNPKYSVPFCVCVFMDSLRVEYMIYTLRAFQDYVTYCSLFTFRIICVFSLKWIASDGKSDFPSALYRCRPESQGRLCVRDQFLAKPLTSAFVSRGIDVHALAVCESEKRILVASFHDVINDFMGQGCIIGARVFLFFIFLCDLLSKTCNLISFVSHDVFHWTVHLICEQIVISYTAKGLVFFSFLSFVWWWYFISLLAYLFIYLFIHSFIDQWRAMISAVWATLCW